MSITRRLGFNSPGRAFSESLLIMFGVLAALAVQSWWEDRVERAVLVSHLEAVRDELSEAETAIQKSLQHSGAVIDRTHAVLTVLAAPPTQHMPDTLMTTLSKMYVTRAASIPTRSLRCVCKLEQLSPCHRPVSAGHADRIQKRDRRPEFSNSGSVGCLL
jgi:hypothetical protein